MKISGISGVGGVASVPPSPVVQRLNAVRRGLREHGAVILKDNQMDREVISRLQRQFGEENVRIEKSNTLKVSVDNFRR